MVLRIKLRTAEDSYIQLIEGYAHRKLPVKQRCFSHYIDEEKASRLLCIMDGELLDFLMKSSEVHGVFLENGQVFVHPDGLIKYVMKDKCRFTERFFDETNQMIERERAKRAV